MEPNSDTRSEERRKQDEQIAAEPPKPRPQSSAYGGPKPMEQFLGPDDTPKPKAVVGIVEDGLVRPVDHGLRLPESQRVLIVGEW